MVWRKQKNIVYRIVGPNEGEWSGLITVNQRHAGIESLTVPRGNTLRWKDLCVVETSGATEKKKEKENVWTIMHACFLGGVSSVIWEGDREARLLHLLYLQRKVSSLTVVDPAHFSECFFTKCIGEERKLQLHFQTHSNTRRAPWSQIIFHFVWFFFSRKLCDTVNVLEFQFKIMAIFNNKQWWNCDYKNWPLHLLMSKEWKNPDLFVDVLELRIVPS